MCASLIRVSEEEEEERERERESKQRPNNNNNKRRPECGANCNANIINKWSFINFDLFRHIHINTYTHLDACERVNLDWHGSTQSAPSDFAGVFDCLC